MKNTPIVILNRDRLYPLVEQVTVLQEKGYNNIVVIDNQSTYIPLLEWYKTANIDVFYNTITENSNQAFLNLVRIGHKKFVDIVQNWYVFNDSDIIPERSVPDDFVEHLIKYATKFGKTKVGMSIRIDDLDLSYDLNKWVYGYESSYWTHGLKDGDVELYPHPIDTTFAVHAPGTMPVWSDTTLRAGSPYIVRHAPFYYDPNNLPDDEIHYLRHMNRSSSNWSSKVKIN